MCGPLAEQLKSVPCGQSTQDSVRGREELSPAQIKDRDHIFLILEVKDTP